MQQTLLDNRCPYCTGLLMRRTTPPSSRMMTIAECCSCGARESSDTFAMARAIMVKKASANSFTAGKSLRIIMEKTSEAMEEKIQACKKSGFKFIQKRIVHKLGNGSKSYTAVMGRI